MTRAAISALTCVSFKLITVAGAERSGCTAICRKGANFTRVGSAAATGRARNKEFVEPRQIAMYLFRDILAMSYPDIANKVGKRDHTTAIYAFEKISKEINKNQNLNQKVLLIKDLLGKE